MLNFKTISKIFSNFLNDSTITYESEEKLNYLIRLNIKTNRKLWDIEDSARMTDLGSEHIAIVKQEIDKNNQTRNDLIKKIDSEIKNQVQAMSPDAKKQFYSESPGMIIDRLAILFIKLFIIRRLLLIIEEKDLKKDYIKKEAIVSKQINHLGSFLDSYLVKLKNKEIFFEAQQPIKIYNDIRIKKYIKFLRK